MLVTPDITRPDHALIEGLRNVGTATISGELFRLGIRNPHMAGLTTWRPGSSVVGPALTLQWMPQREDPSLTTEYAGQDMNPARHVLYHTQPGDIVVVDGRGNMASGVFGEMMLTYFKAKGGVAAVIDGCIRDWPHADPIGLPMWMRGVTPNHGWQNGIYPFAVNVPIACAGVLIMPGDIIVADDDGAVVVPVKLAAEVARKTAEKNAWEDFVRIKLAAGGDLRKYYPMNAEARAEYEAWSSR